MCDSEDNIGLTTSQMKQILEVSRMFAVTADLESLLLKISHTVCSLLNCERASIWLYDAAANELYTTVSLHAEKLRIPAHTGIVGAAFDANRVVTVHRAYEDARFNPSSDKLTGFTTLSLMAIPMVDIDAKPVGVIQAVNKCEDCFCLQDESLVQLLADQAGVAIQRHRLQQVARQAAQMQREMQLAQDIQQGMLPKTLPTLPGYDIAAWARQASTTGGDCYDLWTLPDGRLGILLADASGHGLAPALVVSQVRTLVRSLCEGSPKLDRPHDVLARVNQRIFADLASGKFITAFLGFLSSDGTLDWQSAGQGPILIRRSADADIDSINPCLPPINAIAEFPEEIPPSLRLEPGGMLALVSDGIFESFDPQSQLFGIDRTAECLNSQKASSSAAVISEMRQAIQIWQQHDQPGDDQTIVLINRCG